VIVYVATKNAGKFAELRHIFAGSGWDLQVHPAYEDVAEGDESYDENAALKARALFTRLCETTGCAAVLGDDSGLEVAALGGRPGVRSARYGGPNATWAERRQALLAELATSGTSDRRARFVCALHFIGPDGRAYGVRSSLEGEIAAREIGAAGFSYDPLFLYPPLGITFGEMREEEKNRLSHRALAARALIEALDADECAPEMLAPTGNTAPTGT